MNLTELSVRRPVFTSIVYIAVTIFGLVALSRLPIDLYPEFENPVITVVTAYPGASSWDVEEKVTKPMEKGLGILPGLKQITSRSSEGISAVYLQFTYDTRLDEASNDIRNSIDWVKRNLPDGLENPMLFKFNTSFFPVYFGAIVSDLTDVSQERTYLEEHVIQALQSVPGVGAAQLFRVAADEVHVDLRLDDLEKRNIPIAQISQVLAASNVSMPAGRLEDREYDLPVRVPAEFQSVDEIADTIVGASQGQPIHLRDLADVAEAYRELPNVAHYNGKSVAVFMVQKQSGANTVKVARAIKSRLQELEPSMAKGMSFIDIFDSSEFIESMIINLYKSLALAGLLVVLVVVLFLRRVRATFVVAMAIPGSMILAFLLMYLKGYTLNAVSLMAMTLAVGMVVDNSIVVLENINRHLDKGSDPARSAIRGTREVALAISASTLTTVGIFLPVVFVTGLISILFGQLAYVIIATLVASLVTSLFLTPMLCARLLRPASQDAPTPERSRWLVRLEDAYTRLVRQAIDHRVRVYLLAIGLFAVSLLTLLRLGFDFLPVFDSGEVRVTLELPVGSSIEKSRILAESLTDKIQHIPEVEKIYFQAGEDDAGWGAVMGQREGTHVVQLSLGLYSLKTGRRKVQEVAEDIRALVAQVDGLVAWDVTYGDQGPGQIMGSKPLLVEILGQDYDRLKKAAYEVESIMKSIKGTRDVVAEVPYEKPEVRIALDRRRMALLGTSAFQASDAVRTAIFGSQVTRFRGQGKDIDVVVRLRPEDRDDLSKIGRVLVSSATGTPVSLRNFSDVTSGFSPISVDHVSQRRVLRVGANLQGSSLVEAMREFESRVKPLRERYPELAFQFGGQAKEQQETGLDLIIMLALGIILTYLIMAAQFESFMDPFVIMFSVPFAFTGSFLALVVTGQNFNVLAFLGLIMLVGIVVNNAIVLVDYVNFLRKDQVMPLIDAVVETSRRRLRPILMTTITTLFGVIPLALASGDGHELWQPIGTTMVGGLALSSGVTLILIPCMYVSFERFRRKDRFERRRAAEAATHAAIGPDQGE